MRHRVSGKKLNRDIKHRRALFKNLITSLIVHGQITTTETKAKVVQGKVDKLFTKAKKGNLHSRRQIDSVLNNTKLTNKLVDELAPKTKRVSGYTRITRLGRRSGDNAMLTRLEFVDSIYQEPVRDKKKPKANNQKQPAAKKTSAQKSTSKSTKKTTTKSNKTTKSKKTS